MSEDAVERYRRAAHADRCQRAVDSCRESAMASGGAKWVAAVDEFIAALRATLPLPSDQGIGR
jgi:hypothetical protein